MTYQMYLVLGMTYQMYLVLGMTYQMYLVLGIRYDVPDVPGIRYDEPDVPGIGYDVPDVPGIRYKVLRTRCTWVTLTSLTCVKFRCLLSFSCTSDRCPGETGGETGWATDVMLAWKDTRCNV